MDNTKISKGISIGVRVAALLLLLFFFIPSICVSCQDVSVDVSGFNAAIGNIRVEGENIDDIEAAPWLFIILVLAVAIGVLATKYHIATMACAAANIVMMYIYKGAVKAWVKDYFEDYASYVKVKTTGVFLFTIIFCVLIIMAVAFDKFVLNHAENKAKLEALIKKYIKKESAPELACAICGQKIEVGAQFCSRCGASVTAPASAEEPVAVASEAALAEENNVPEDAQ